MTTERKSIGSGQIPNTKFSGQRRFISSRHTGKGIRAKDGRQRTMEKGKATREREKGYLERGDRHGT